MNFTVKLPDFDGKDNSYPVSQWVSNIEEIADDFGWPSGLLLLKARRSLTGLAASWLRAEERHKTWEELKTALIDEFTVEEGYKTRIQEMAKVYMEAMYGNCAQINHQPIQRLQMPQCEEAENETISTSLSNGQYQEEDEIEVHQNDVIHPIGEDKQTCFTTMKKDGAAVEEVKRLIEEKECTVKDDIMVYDNIKKCQNDDDALSNVMNVNKVNSENYNVYTTDPDKILEEKFQNKVEGENVGTKVKKKQFVTERTVHEIPLCTMKELPIQKVVPNRTRHLQEDDKSLLTNHQYNLCYNLYDERYELDYQEETEKNFKKRKKEEFYDVLYFFRRVF